MNNFVTILGAIFMYLILFGQVNISLWVAPIQFTHHDESISLSLLTLVSAGLFLLHFPPSSLSQLLQCFYLFLHMLPQRCHQHCWWAQLWAAAGLLWSQLNLAVGNGGSFSALLAGATPAVPSYLTHATSTQYAWTLPIKSDIESNLPLSPSIPCEGKYFHLC